ncbi:MAG: outer membrane beta-barrel protein [Bacteroidota bacterium]
MAKAQNPAEILKSDSTKIHIGGYVDVYYGFDFNEPDGKNRPYFVNNSRHNEFAVNMAMLDFKFISPKARAIIRPAFGTFMQANYVAEPDMFRFLYEANAGIKLSRKKDIWLDAGIFYSPYTNESAISKDHLLYTRSLSPEYVPYYLNGLRASVVLNNKLNLYLYLTNGWQVIQDYNNHICFGSQLEYRPNKKWLFNWNTFTGDTRSVSFPNYRTRLFSDVFYIWNKEGKFSSTGCVYAGIQERIDSTGKNNSYTWFSANITGKASIDEGHFISARWEIFSDPDMIMIVPVTGVKGFVVNGASVCYNWKITENIYFRTEGRGLFAEENVFYDKNDQPVNTSWFAVSSIAVWF